MFRPLRTEHLYQAAAQEIKRFIAETGLKPGDRLPSEHALCQHLAVGRTSLREALRLLEMDGLIDIKVGRGDYVRRNDLESFFARASGPLLDDSSDLVDLTAVREIMEVEAARLAAENATQQQLDALADRLQRDREKVRQGRYELDDDIDFHRLLFEAAGNPVLQRFVRLIREATRPVYEAYLLGPEAVLDTLAEHTAIYEAVRGRRPEMAVEEIRSHLRTTADLIIARCRDTEEPKAGDTVEVAAGAAVGR